MRKTITLLIALLALTVSSWATQITWDQAAVQSVNVSCNGENYYRPQSQAVNGISVTANTPNSGSNSDYSYFYYDTYEDANVSRISVGGDGTLTFSSVNMTSIVIHTDENYASANGWTWSDAQHTLTWTGNAASVVMANAYVSNITSIEFEVSIPSSYSWNQATVQSINVSCNGENYYEPQSQAINGISVTANTPNSGSNSDYSYFYYDTYEDANVSRISVGGDGTLTFSSVNMTSIVIHTDENYASANGWTWSDAQHTLTWTGNAASVVMTDAYVSNITSIDFTFASNDPEPTPTPVISTVIWEGTDLTSVDVRASNSDPQSLTIDGSVNITVTAAAPEAGDYSEFKTYDENNTSISVDANGTLTFTPASGKLTGIVIECEFASNTGTLVEGSGWDWNPTSVYGGQLIWTSATTEGASSVVLACDGSKNGCNFSSVSSVKFTFAAEEPAPDPEPAGNTITWDTEVVNGISLDCPNQYDDQSTEEMDGITASLTRTFAEGSACYFKGREVRICGNGELTFSSSDGNISSIVITYDYKYYDPTSLPAGWTHDAEAMTFTWDGTPSNAVTISGNIDFNPTSIVFTVVPATPEPTEIATIHFAENLHNKITEFTHTDDDCGHRNGFLTPLFNVWLENENGQAITDVMPLTVTSSDEDVVTVSLGDYYGPTDPDRLITCQPTGYGTATITATFDGNETYFPTQASFTYHFYRNENSMAACALVDKNSVPVTSIVATEGELIDAPHLTRVGGGDLCYTYLAMATTTNRSRWRLKEETGHWDYFYPMKAGLDTIVFTYYRESSFDSREKEDYKYWDQGVEVRIPVQINPLITPIAAKAQTQMKMNPAINANMSFSNTVADLYNSTADQLEIQSVVDPVKLKLAVDSMAAGTKDWNDLLPGATTFNIQPGRGKLSIQCETTAGYELKVLVRGQGTVSVSQPSMGIATVEYDVDQVTTVLIYLAATGGSSAPKRAPAAIKEDAPKAIIKSITITPGVDIIAKQDPDHSDVYYSTFYDGTYKYALPNDGTKAFVAKIDGSDMIMTEIADKDEVIPAETAVILQSPTGLFSLTPSDGDAVTFTASDNQLQGTDSEMAAPENCYVLSGKSADNTVTGVGFYQFSGPLAAHKAYLTIGGGSSALAPKRLRFVFNGENAATGIENTSANFGESEKRLENGQLIIIKNGVRYNAQGQIVK